MIFISKAHDALENAFEIGIVNLTPEDIRALFQRKSLLRRLRQQDMELRALTYTDADVSFYEVPADVDQAEAVRDFLDLNDEDTFANFCESVDEPFFPSDFGDRFPSKGEDLLHVFPWGVMFEAVEENVGTSVHCFLSWSLLEKFHTHHNAA